MKKTASELAVFALEQVGVKYTYGIPGTHTTEIYDALEDSKQITPILVTHELGGAFMADATSRTSDGIGCMVVVPGAGATHAMSGIAEAYLDGIPMLILSGGVRTDSGKSYQLHQMSLEKLVAGAVKGYYKTELYSDVIPMIYDAYELAVSGEPGPVFVEIPVNLMLLAGDVVDMPNYVPTIQKPYVNPQTIQKVVDALISAKNPMMYLGWGSVKAFDYSVKIAELLVAPVATTLQGKSAFPNSHPLFTSNSIGMAGKESCQKALKQQDVLLTVGARFGEVGTSSYALDQPKGLIHVDINPEVFDKNFKTDIKIHGDAVDVLKAIYEELIKRNYKSPRDIKSLGQSIKADNLKYQQSWLGEKLSDNTSPGHFFETLKKFTDENTMFTVDDGHHTFLANELFEINKPAHFISPTDFNAMGYCVPAMIATKLTHPNNRVIGIVGDGAVLMTGNELVTAQMLNTPTILFIFNDGELAQITHFMELPLNRKTCGIIGQANYEGLAILAGAEYVQINSDLELDTKMTQAFELNDQGKLVVVNVKMDYSKKTLATLGAIKANAKRLPLSDKLRMAVRIVKRRIGG